MKKVVVVLPTYNEKENIENFIKEVLEQESSLPGWRVEVLVADSNSPDGTGEIVRRLTAKNSRVHLVTVGRGLGVGLIEGHQYSLRNLYPDMMAQLDADGQVMADVLVRLIKVIEGGYDLALGSRFIKGGENRLSLSRRIFSAGMSLVCRLIMGPFSIKEFANSARAFTPELFKKINLDRLPWREKTFIIQPAFLNEAILAGARYKEVPLVFKNRAEGYSKNKVFNYTYDVITYTIDARLHRWGINTPFFYWTRRAKTLVKFSLVGFTGTVVDFIFYNLFIAGMGLRPATSKAFSTEIAIINNFFLNNFWTFRYRQNKKSLWQKLVIFNLVSLGGLSLGVLVIKLLHILYGDGFIQLIGFNIPYYNLYFFASIPPVLIWNFAVNHLWTFKHKPED